MTLSLVDLSARPVRPDADTLTVRTTCTNRDLPSRLPFGNEPGDFELEGGAAIKRIVALKKPTNAIRPPSGKAALWRLISHLSLNYLSLVDEGREAFQEILKLYNFTGSAYSEKQIDGIIGLKSARHFARLISENGVTFARGTRVEMEFDEEQFVGGGVFLFASVIEHVSGRVRVAQQLHPAHGAHAAEKGGPQGMATPGRTDDFWLQRSASRPLPGGGSVAAPDAAGVRVLSGGASVRAPLPGPRPGGAFREPLQRSAAVFGAHASMPFPASRIQRVDWPEESGPAPRMVINFMGLAGPSGVLPLYYTEHDRRSPAERRTTPCGSSSISSTTA